MMHVILPEKEENNEPSLIKETIYTGSNPFRRR